MLPGETAKQNRGVRTLIGSERPFYRTMKMRWLVESGKLAQTRALGFQAGLDFRFVLNLDEKTDINDWEALFGAEAAGMGLDGGKVPGWTDGGVDEMVF